MKRLNLLLSILFLCVTGIFAEIKLPALIGDYMVLQQASKVRLWGEATPIRMFPFMLPGIITRVPLPRTPKANGKFGYNTITCRGPEYDRMEIDKDKITLYFQHVGNGFDRDNGIVGFEIAGKDMRFHPANATIDGWNKTVIVSAPGVKSPVAVRYCFKDFQVGNLHNVAGLPVIPFRTDH